MALTPAERQKRYRDAHPDRVQAQSERRTISGRAAKAAKRYRARHPEKVHAYDRKYAKDHPTYIKLGSYVRRHRHPVFQYVQQYKAAHPCADCGETDPIVLDFDHVRGVKNFSIGNNVTTRSLAAVKEEIKKCEVVCANCHRKRTALRVRDRLQNIENVSTRLLEQVFK